MQTRKMQRQQLRCQPAPRNPAFWLLRFFPHRQRRKRKRRVFRNWFGFKRGGILSFLLYRHGRRFFLYWRRRRCFRFFRSCRPLCFTEHKLRLFRRIWRILRAANKKRPSRSQFSPHYGFQPERPQNHRPQAAIRLSDRCKGFRRP